jgi:hypothetical protein
LKARFLSMLACKARFEGPLSRPVSRPALKARFEGSLSKAIRKAMHEPHRSIPLPQQSRRLYNVGIQFITSIAATTPDAKDNMRSGK